jgi:hypothetical protein
MGRWIESFTAARIFPSIIVAPLITVSSSKTARAIDPAGLAISFGGSSRKAEPTIICARR